MAASLVDVALRLRPDGDGSGGRVSDETIAAVLLIAVPIAFNVTFTMLGMSFRYPAILREPPGQILTAFTAGGTGLVLRWWAFALTALAMLPLVVCFGSLFAATGGTLVVLTIFVGALAGLVQALGLMRWPFLVPTLARRYASASTPAERTSIETIFEVVHRYLGVGIGEHMGYLLTGSWTVLTGLLILSSPLLPVWLGWLALPIGVALLLGSLEFVGANEPRGWSVADKVTPIAYIAWSLWLMGCGVLLLVT